MRQYIRDFVADCKKLEAWRAACQRFDEAAEVAVTTRKAEEELVGVSE